MKASNIFKILVRSLMVIFVIAFVKNYAFSSSIKDDYKTKIGNLQLENTNMATASWLSADQKLAKAHYNTGMKYFTESKNDQFKSEINTAKLLIADDRQSLLYLEVEKAEKAFENVIALKKNFESYPTLTQKFVRLISMNNPMVVGHIIEEKNDLISIRDQDGFIIPILRKNVTSIEEIKGSEKKKIYKELLAKIMEDNGTTSSYGLYLSAKWAHENDLQDKVNSILMQAAMQDTQILYTISDNEARKILSAAKWSNLLGDYEIAKEKAQLVISAYANTSQLKDAQDTLQDILKNLEKEKSIKAALYNNKPTEEVVSNKTPEEPQKFVEAPELKPATKPVEAIPEVIEPPKKNTLKLRSQTQEDVNKQAISKPEEKTDEVIEEKKMVKGGKMALGKNSPLADKTFQDAADLVKEGKELMKKANAYDNPGNKNAQACYQKALGIFKSAVSKLNSLGKKYAGDDDFEELANQASGMEFFITKSCLRIKY